MRRNAVQADNKKYHRKAKIKLKVNGELWRQVPNFNDSAADDKHYVLDIGGNGTADVVFGDGKQGARPPSGRSNIKATFSPNIHYNSVRLQQGRLKLDDDCNEATTSSGCFCGIYQGLVMDNADPQSLMRLLVQVPAVLDTQNIWALPCIPTGATVVPTIGKGVWIMFENGAPDRPVWMGTWPGIE